MFTGTEKQNSERRSGFCPKRIGHNLLYSCDLRVYVAVLKKKKKTKNNQYFLLMLDCWLPIGEGTVTTRIPFDNDDSDIFFHLGTLMA